MKTCLCLFTSFTKVAGKYEFDSHFLKLYQLIKIKASFDSSYVITGTFACISFG
jgi:hypothetical protein